jgi:hypothetical protein
MINEKPRAAPGITLGMWLALTIVGLGMWAALALFVASLWRLIRMMLGNA